MKNVYLAFILVAFFLPLKSQYMSRSQPVPFACPTVCPGSVLVIEVFQVQGLNQGDVVQALLSNSSGSFTTGTTTLTPTAYSLNSGSTWTNGAFTYSADVNNLYLQITIPVNLPAGTGYTIKMKSSSGYIANDLFSCSGSNYITVIAGYTVLGNLGINTAGNNQWVGHVYSWVSNTTSPLFTSTLVNAQNFFDANNYKGYFLKDSLGFNINYLTAGGGTCPGAPGPLNDGTNIPCSQGSGSLFSIKMLRTQNFAPGSYRFTIDGDDGIRLSIDGGNTWLLSSFFEQTYPNGFRSTDSLNPNGICLSGQTNLVIEFFQRNVDAHLSFTVTQLSSSSVADAGNQTTCNGGNVNFNLTPGSGLTYQWYYSSDNGSSFQVVPNTAPFSGANTSNLAINNVAGSYNGYLFRCSITGICSAPVNTPTDTLFVVNGGSPISITATKLNICPQNDSAVLCVPAIYSSYLWNTGATTACITTATAGQFYVTTSFRTGCSFPSDHVQVSVLPIITPTIHETGAVISTSTPGSHFQWYDSNSAIAGDTSSSMTVSGMGTYYVAMLDTNGCPEQSAPIVSKITGVTEWSDVSAFNIYPNPVADKCMVVLRNINSAYKQLVVYNALGQLVMPPEVVNGSLLIDMQHLASGIYFFRLGNEVKRLVKE